LHLFCRSLEAVIEEQKEEILELMQNQAVPRSPSPLPPETKDFSLQTVQEMHSQTVSMEHRSVQTEVRLKIVEISINLFNLYSLQENHRRHFQLIGKFQKF